MERIRRNLILKTLLSGLSRLPSFSHFTAVAHQASNLPAWINDSIQFGKRPPPFSRGATRLITRGSPMRKVRRDKTGF